MSRIAYVNGRYVPHAEAAVHVEDRGYQFADGVYEVIAVHKGAFLGETAHFERLAHSLKELGIAWPMAQKPMSMVLREVARRNDVKDGLIYLQITRGVAPRDHQFPVGIKSSMVVTAVKRAPINKSKLLAGIDVISVPDIRWKRVDIKTVGLLPNCLAKQKAVEAGAQEVFQIDGDGFVTEGAATNAWIVTKAGELVTRDVSTSILNGITRLAIIEAAREHGIKIVERAFTMAEALDAREAFISSSNSHVKAVTRIDGQSIGNGHAGELTTRLLDIYMRFMEQVGGPSQAERWN